MKKLIFLVAMLFIAGIAMSQTTNVIQSNSNVSQSGQNKTDVNQTGMNQVTIKQVQNISGTPGGSALISATVEQSGTKDNTITINQTHSGTKNNGVNPLTAFAKQQRGNGNTIVQNQIAGSGNWGNVDFRATQDGSRNTATQKSVEDAGNDNGEIQQKGNDNTATQKWYGRNYRDGATNGELFIHQDGIGNQATQTFLAGTVFSSGTENRGVGQVTQKGNNNIANQRQEGAGNVQYLNQNGNSNEATMNAYGNYNVSNAKQLGNSGTIVFTQKQDYTGPAAEGVVSEGNSIMLSQDGNGSKAYITQDGFSNSIEGLGGTGTFAINNNGAYLKVTQTGTENVIQSRQIGSGASEVVSQMGMNNLAIVNQH